MEKNYNNIEGKIKDGNKRHPERLADILAFDKHDCLESDVDRQLYRGSTLRYSILLVRQAHEREVNGNKAFSYESKRRKRAGF